MNGNIFYLAGNTPAIHYAAEKLMAKGTSFVPSPGPDVTHLLLPVPSFEQNDHIRGGGSLWHILGDLPEDIIVIGGNLDHPALTGYRKIDLLTDPTYVAENGAITADCAVRLAGTQLKIVFHNCPTMVIGWGRIGKCLARHLQNLGARVTVAARKESDLAMLTALGYHTLNTNEAGQHLQDYRLVFNTVPYPIISAEQVEPLIEHCIFIDLASELGIAGKGVIWARGLPGKEVPESSGQLIADTIMRIVQKRRAGK